VLPPMIALLKIRRTASIMEILYVSLKLQKKRRVQRACLAVARAFTEQKTRWRSKYIRENSAAEPLFSLSKSLGLKYVSKEAFGLIPRSLVSCCIIGERQVKFAPI